MFDLSWTHILLVLIVALVVVPPKDLPRTMHTVGRWIGKARSMADQFRKSFDDMARQSELQELRSELEALRHERPLAGLDHDLSKAMLPLDQPAAPPATVAPEPHPDLADLAPPAGESQP